MATHEYNIDLHDVRFVLFEHLAFDELTKQSAYGHVDKESIDLLLDECVKFHREAIAPINRVGDREGCTLTQGRVTTPGPFKAAYRAICDNGWFGVAAPQQFGGLGLPFVVSAATGEMNVGACPAMAMNFGLTHEAASLLETYASNDLVERYVHNMHSGLWQGTMCLTEPQAGSSVGDLRSKAEPSGASDGSWHITGTKIFISSGEHDLCENHIHLVLARTPDAPKGPKGISLFLVPKFLVDEKGTLGAFNHVVCAGIEHKMGIKGSPTCVLNFGESGPCKGWMIGDIHSGLRQMFHMMNRARIEVGLQGLAIANQSYLYAQEYAKTRIQGVAIERFQDPDAPRVAIVEHPDVRRMLLWCKAVVEGSRALIYKTAYYQDLATHHGNKNEALRYAALVDFLTPICKAYVSDMSFEVTRLAMQCMGGYGYIAEYPVEQHLRDVKIASIYEGTNGIQALDLLARKLPAKKGALFMTAAQEIGSVQKHAKDTAMLTREFERFKQELNDWQQTTMKLGAMGMSGDRLYPVLHATPYLEMTGNVVVGGLLLEQAVIAEKKLNALWQEKQLQSKEEKQRLTQENEIARFYANKISTAQFFIHQILIRNHAIKLAIESQDRSALDYCP